MYVLLVQCTFSDSTWFIRSLISIVTYVYLICLFLASSLLELCSYIIIYISECSRITSKSCEFFNEIFKRVNLVTGIGMCLAGDEHFENF